MRKNSELVARLGASPLPDGGVGVLAAREIKKGEVFRMFTGQDYRKISVRALGKMDPTTRTWLEQHGVLTPDRRSYWTPKNWYCLSVAWFLNDGGLRSNVEPCRRRGLEMWRATADIQRDEELLIDYKEVEPEEEP